MSAREAKLDRKVSADFKGHRGNAARKVSADLKGLAVSQVLVTFHAAAAPGPPAPRVTLANQLTR